MLCVQIRDYNLEIIYHVFTWWLMGLVSSETEYFNGERINNFQGILSSNRMKMKDFAEKIDFIKEIFPYF